MADGERRDRAVLLVPGYVRGHQPLLAFTEVAAVRRGGHPKRIWWTPPEADLAALIPWVCDQVRVALDDLAGERPEATRPLLVGKSLGSLAARVAAERELPAIWFTPILNNSALVAEYELVTAPRLLVGGTGDEMWDSTVARQLSPRVLEIPDADHFMIVPGPLAASGRVLGDVAAAVERFLDDVVWQS
jgi:hypothetical protein